MLFTLHMSSVNPLDVANNMYLLKREVKERKILFHTEGIDPVLIPLAHKYFQAS